MFKSSGEVTHAIALANLDAVAQTQFNLALIKVKQGDANQLPIYVDVASQIVRENKQRTRSMAKIPVLWKKLNQLVKMKRQYRGYIMKKKTEIFLSICQSHPEKSQRISLNSSKHMCSESAGYNS